MAFIEKRISKKGEESYRVLVRLKGQPTASATFKRLTDAKIWAKQTEVEIRERRFFKNREAKKHTVADMIDRYLERLKKTNPSRYPEVSAMLAWWKEEIGYCLLADLSRALVTEKIEKLSGRSRTLKDGSIKVIAPARVNRYITGLSHACTIAMNEWEWLETHPLQKISKLREPRGRVRFLDDDERARLLKVCRESRAPMLYPAVVLALSTGMRQGEILGLSWKDVDFSRKVIVLHKTKNNERRVVPLSGHALELLIGMRKIRQLHSDWVFPAPRNPKKIWDCRVAWDAAVIKAGIEDFRFHDLRHSAASYLAMNGATLAELAEVLGHKTLQMVKRYAHLSEAHTHSVVASMNEKIFGNKEKANAK